jgi:hypothetical protein
MTVASGPFAATAATATIVMAAVLRAPRCERGESRRAWPGLLSGRIVAEEQAQDISRAPQIAYGVRASGLVVDPGADERLGSEELGTC